ncbi:uncharacterized protein LOC135338456 isoform X1 [Halichondria panicea]|uniref:uncharacterized protein LOC135338456 isoform X1 n=1 Tax=Halichondria panicea TaxID=6063 RepID=UPI00312BA030
MKCNVAVNDSALVVRILELTLKDKGDVTTKVNENNRLLFACKFGYTAIVRYLINQCNVDVNGAVTSDGLTPLGVAIREGKLDTIKYLITECNVDINIGDGLTPLGLAVEEGKMNTIKYLISECNVAVNDVLLLACKYGVTKIVKYLLNDVVGCDPNIKDDDGHTPLFLAGNKEIILLLLQHGATAEDVYTNHRKALGKLFSKDPLKNPVKMFVIGHGGEGKSTLIEAMEHEPTARTYLVNIFVSPKEVDGVSQKTAGIIPRLFKSRVFGDVLVYDFAGQEVYYSSHAAIIKNTVDTCPPVFVMVIGLQNNDTITATSVSYWLGIVANQCANMEGKAPLIVVGSHADLVTSTQAEQKKKIIVRAIQKFSMFDLAGFVSMDCRFSSSDGMTSFRHIVETSCASIRERLSVSLNAHMFLVHLLDKYSGEIAVTLEEVQGKMKDRVSRKDEKVLSFVPTSCIPRLVEICVQLSDKGHILFLCNASFPEKSFIVIDKSKLLAEVNGTILAPEDFTQHCELSTSTGVVLKSDLAKHFPNFNIDMLIGYLFHLELAVPIEDKIVLSLIDQHLPATSVSVSGGVIFCPALIRLVASSEPMATTINFQYSFNWSLACAHNDHFFNPRFLHVLLLRLSLSLGLAPVVDTDNPALQGQCSVWKTGVCWVTEDGIRVRVEVMEMKSVTIQLQAPKVSLDVLDVRSTIINKVVEAACEFCPNIDTDERLLPSTDIAGAPLFGMKSVAKSISCQKEFVKSTTSTQVVPVGELLQSEVYADLRENILQALCNEGDPAHDEKLSDGLLSALSSCWSKNRELSDIVCSVVSRAAKSTHAMSGSLEHALRVWRDSGDGTCRALRLILDPLSVFSGKNPLVLAGVAPTFFCENMLPQQPDESTELSPSPSTHEATQTTIEERNEVRQPSSLGPAANRVTLQDLVSRYSLTDEQLNSEIGNSDIPYLAEYFDGVKIYSSAMGLTPAEQADVNRLYCNEGTQVAMTECLILWKRHDPFAATHKALLELLLGLRKDKIADDICQHLTQ